MKLSLVQYLAIAIVVLGSAGFASGQLNRTGPCITRFGQQEWALLLETVPEQSKANFIENEEIRKAQVDNLKTLLSFACSAVKNGVAREKTNAVELKSIRSETVAVAYDREVTAHPVGPPFAGI